MSPNQDSIFLQIASGGLANALTSAFLNPMDVAKTRMQAETVKANQIMNKHNLIRTFRTLYQSSGVIGLWSPGLKASMVREMVNSGTRAGLYLPVRDYYKAQVGEDSLLCKCAAAITTGTIGALLANPIDVVKIRLMVDPAKYPGLLRGMNVIVQQEGLVGLYKGLIPSTLRGASIAVGELATYDASKSLLKSHVGMKEGFVLHTVTSLITGLVATTVAAPFDLLKTRAMNAVESNKGIIAIVSNVIREEGVTVLFRGWLPAYLRLGPHALICFPVFEQIRRLFGLSYF